MKKYKNYIKNTVHFNETCNFRCKYCSEDGDKESYVIDPSEHEFIMDHLVADINTDNFNLVSILGGEPMLENELVTESIDRLNDTGKDNFCVNIFTNGHYFRPDVIDAMKRVPSGEYMVCLSSDTFDMTRTQRYPNQTTADLTKESFAKYIEIVPQDKLMCLFVVTDTNEDSIVNDVKTVYDMGIRNFLIDLDFFSLDSQKEEELYQKLYKIHRDVLAIMPDIKFMEDPPHMQKFIKIKRGDFLYIKKKVSINTEARNLYGTSTNIAMKLRLYNEADIKPYARYFSDGHYDI